MDQQRVREAIKMALPDETSLRGSQPQREKIYIPESHKKALQLNNSLIIGSRGVGKTFWSAALREKSILKMLGAEIPNLEKTDVYAGFGEKVDNNYYPDKNVFKQLFSEKLDAYDVWRAVLVRWAAEKLNKKLPIDLWKNTVAWVIKNPEPVSELFRELNENFRKNDLYGLIVFDALDRASADWRDMDKILKGLLMVSLEIKPFSNIFSKIFLRDDQYKRPDITSFPDASKLTANRVDLTWNAQDLYGLLWQYFCNATNEYGEIMRKFICENDVKVEKISDVWVVAPRAKNSEETQRKIFEAIAGKWMGSGIKRGNTYTWCVSHLADGYGRTSPRSFIAAIREASEDSSTRYQTHDYPLHYESIKRGVQKASEIRVNELKEDYPWIERVMSPLERINVPCAFGDILQKWNEAFNGKSPNKTFDKNDNLPPASYKEGWEGIRSDIESLGIFDTTKDGRVNMPDLYRIAFKIGRKGGVPPKHKNE